MLVVVFHTTYAQSLPDSLKAMVQKTILANKTKTSYTIIPRQATIRSAIIPGWGQLYAKHYWTIPLIYGGFAAAGYATYKNNEGYKEFLDLYLQAKQSSTGTIMYGNREVTAQQIAPIKDGYRRNRDLSYFSLGAIWILNIIEVNVAAHLKTFDISDDISMAISPLFTPTIASSSMNTGIKLTLNFK